MKDYLEGQLSVFFSQESDDDSVLWLAKTEQQVHYIVEI